MKSVSLFMALLCVSPLGGAEELASWFGNGKAYGNIKYYYIETDKDDGAGTTTSAHANAVGGTLGYETAPLYGLQLGATFMATSPFALPDTVDTSIIGKDNGVRGGDPEAGFAVLGEAYLQYRRGGAGLWYGRRVIRTPLIDAKEVRMLPSAVQGGMAAFGVGPLYFEAGYLDRFKQRTSDEFVNIIAHALGADTEEVTGHTAGYVLPLHAVYKAKAFQLQAYDYYAPDFMNALYLGAKAVHDFPAATLSIGAQYLREQSIGNADINLVKSTSITGGKLLKSNAFGLKAEVEHRESVLYAAYTKVLRNEESHDSLVLPWDGTPLFTNMITSNNLFQSLYGSAFKADSAYIGGTDGVKLAYTQGFDFTGCRGFKTTIAWAQYSSNREGFDRDQSDINAVIGYARKNFSLAFKGIWVNHNTSMNSDGTVSQLDKLTQYRVIANYQF